MTTLPLGQPVRFFETLTRRYQPAAPRSKRVWESDRYHSTATAATGRAEGIIVGIRTLSDGECDDGYYDNPTIYYPTRTFTAYLVAYHLRRKPVLVLPERLEAT